MTWVEKLETLRGRLSLAQIEQAAAWPLNSLSATIKAGSVPNARKAVQLSRALGVSTDWLFDDEQGLPAPRMAVPPVQITPWPPNGLTWNELQIAISDYVVKRTRERLERLNRDLADSGTELVTLDPIELNKTKSKRDRK